MTLARVLRAQRPERILVELADEEHLRTFERVLAEWPLSQYIAPARYLVLPADEYVRPSELEAR